MVVICFCHYGPEIQEANSNLDYNTETGNQVYFWLRPM
jgi:hypothetical protein